MWICGTSEVPGKTTVSSTTTTPRRYRFPPSPPSHSLHPPPVFQARLRPSIPPRINAASMVMAARDMAKEILPFLTITTTTTLRLITRTIQTLTSRPIILALRKLAPSLLPANFVLPDRRKTLEPPKTLLKLPKISSVVHPRVLSGWSTRTGKLVSGSSCKTSVCVRRAGFA